MCDEVTGKFGIELAPELRSFVLRQNGDNFYAETLSFAIEINGISPRISVIKKYMCQF